MRRALLAGLLLLGLPLTAAGPTPRFDEDGFQLARPPYRFEFPRDHAAHPAFRTEWWYYTGHLRAGGRPFGFEVTFFRVALPGPAPGASSSAWRARHVIFRHLALTDEQAGRFRHDERAERAALGLAGADSARFDVWLDDDRATLAADGRTHLVRAAGGGVALELALVPQKPPVVHGRDGVSRKGPGEGEASHYASLTRLAASGRLVVDGDTLEVSGRAWMDHEFASDPPRETLAGWDWFSVQLDDGVDLMLYRLRRRDGSVEPASSGTWVGADGRARPLPLEAFDVRALGEWRSPHTGAHYPSGWRLRLPAERLELTLTPVLADQELVVESMGGIAYWEGRVRVAGRRGDRSVSGAGYVELTGYAGPAPFGAGRLPRPSGVR